MIPFEVYPVYPIEIVKGHGFNVFDRQGNEYLDFYGGHAVISIGHSHPHYVKRVTEQLAKLGFYSNSVEIPIQKETATKLGELSGYDDYSVFFCNSGAEAIENALKLASFKTGRERVMGFRGSFHGRTSLAAMLTDAPSIQAPVNKTPFVEILSWEDQEEVFKELESKDYCAVIIEGIQGIGGILIPDDLFLEKLADICKKTGTLLILDEIQSGFGRTGKFFAHQYTKVKPDLITVAKGMGNGFPVGAVLIDPEINPSFGLLGSTFGGNHLACAAVLAVLDVLQEEDLIERARTMGDYLRSELNKISNVEVRGRGLMIGIDFEFPVKGLRTLLLTQYKIFTGSARNEYTLRLLPPLSVGKNQADYVIESINSAMKNLQP